MGDFLEYGEFDGHYYGLAIEELLRVIKSGRMPVLDIEPRSLLKLRSCHQVAPIFTILVRPPSNFDCGAMSRLRQESVAIESLFAPFVDEIVDQGDHLVTAIDQLLQQEKLRWLPLPWLYN